MSLLSTLVNTTLSIPGLPALFSPLLRGQGIVFMLHRFADPERGVAGKDPQALREMLGILRRGRCHLLPIQELVNRLEEGNTPAGAVAVTIDDGYYEQASIAGPIFAEFDCPVTTFITTGFVDGQLWLWWDKIEYVFRRASRSPLRVHLGEHELRYAWRDERSRAEGLWDFTERCKQASDVEKHAAIQRLAKEAEVELPVLPPPEYEPMSWNDLRTCEGRGMTFGPHTVTHPILSRVSDEQARKEIQESWTRLSQEAHSALPLFAYPNGRTQDFGQREIDLLQAAGFTAGLATEPGFNTRSKVTAHPHGRYRLHRFGADANSMVTRVASGFERFRLLLHTPA